MENCSVKILDYTSNNGKLPKLGEMVLDVVVNDGSIDDSQRLLSMSTFNTGTLQIRVSDGGYFGTTPSTIESEHLTSFEITNAMGLKTFYFANGNYRIFVKGREHIQRMQFGGTSFLTPSLLSMDVEDLKYCERLTYFGASFANVNGELSGFDNMTNLNTFFIMTTTRRVYGNISIFANKSSLSQVNFGNSKCEGDISAFAGKSNLSQLQVYGCDITGDISSIGGNKSLTRVNFAATKVFGTFESFANAQVSSPSPRTSGQCVLIGNGIMTYNDIVVPDETVKTVYFGSSMEGHSPTSAETAQGWCIR